MVIWIKATIPQYINFKLAMLQPEEKYTVIWEEFLTYQFSKSIQSRTILCKDIPCWTSLS